MGPRATKPLQRVRSRRRDQARPLPVYSNVEPAFLHEPNVTYSTAFFEGYVSIERTTNATDVIIVRTVIGTNGGIPLTPLPNTAKMPLGTAGLSIPRGASIPASGGAFAPHCRLPRMNELLCQVVTYPLPQGGSIVPHGHCNGDIQLYGVSVATCAGYFRMR